jgi:hypothetical protein
MTDKSLTSIVFDVCIIVIVCATPGLLIIDSFKTRLVIQIPSSD